MGAERFTWVQKSGADLHLYEQTRASVHTSSATIRTLTHPLSRPVQASTGHQAVPAVGTQKAANRIRREESYHADVKLQVTAPSFSKQILEIPR